MPTPRHDPVRPTDWTHVNSPDDANTATRALLVLPRTATNACGLGARVIAIGTCGARERPNGRKPASTPRRPPTERRPRGVRPYTDAPVVGDGFVSVIDVSIQWRFLRQCVISAYVTPTRSTQRVPWRSCTGQDNELHGPITGGWLWTTCVHLPPAYGVAANVLGPRPTINARRNSARTSGFDFRRQLFRCVARPAGLYSSF